MQDSEDRMLNVRRKMHHLDQMNDRLNWMSGRLINVEETLQLIYTSANQVVLQSHMVAGKKTKHKTQEKNLIVTDMHFPQIVYILLFVTIKLNIRKASVYTWITHTCKSSV